MSFIKHLKHLLKCFKKNEKLTSRPYQDDNDFFNVKKSK